LRMTTRYESPSSTVRTMDGTMRESNARCSSTRWKIP
jgi:hypothetical protein